MNFKPDWVFHLAAESHVDRSIAQPSDFIRTNVHGTFVLLEAAQHHWEKLTAPEQAARRFLHVSTDEVYGSLLPGDYATETAAINSSSPYAASKAAADQLVLAWARTYRLPALITRSSNNYGPYQFPEKLIPRMIALALHGQPLPVYHDGSNIRDWLHVDDQVRALMLIASHGDPGGIYNVSARAPRQNIDVVRMICATLDRLTPGPQSHFDLVTHVADRPGHDHRYAVDPAKIENDLGWRPFEDFETGLEKTVQWFLANRTWWQPLFKT